MFKKLIFIYVLLLFVSPIKANCIIGGDILCVTSIVSSYTGPGDIVSGWQGFWSLQAFSGTYASGGGKLANACLPSSATCADIVSNSSGQPVIPVALSSCNNSTTKCTVDILYDQSGALACGGAACDMVRNGTQANDPVLVIAGAANGCPNTANACISTISTTQFLRTGNSVNFSQTQPYSLWGVAIRTSPSGTTQSPIIGSFNTGFVFGFGFTAGNIRCGFGSPVEATGFTENTWGTTQALANGASSKLIANGSSSTVSCGIANFASDILYLAYENSIYGLNGNIAEAGILSGDASSSAVSLNTNAHSANRWNF